MAKKKPSLHNADKWFSIYTRIRDCDGDGEGVCCSCGKSKIYWRDADAGHFIPRQHRATRYHERNVHLQCRHCNRFNNGAPGGYASFIIQRYGVSTLENLDRLSRTTVKWTAFEINNMAETFKQKAQQIAKEKGIIL